ncbi:hypothetical protein M407DRAFT_17163 [Tulasnella calospora MUT 4182]|uniref:Uncharacterized protein n=1 Tax=Tulasnella calospora MUT 4182 TaxID=1051891 RepID=A0A0C3QXR7_9AGAM|nr:hypothetical protein M407DRAFT_17163 [Tulasnella calospora MUT 4182]
MSSEPHVDLFKGTDWKECDTFVRALRSRALWEGKQRDPAWIADFAAPHFSYKALLWHSRLPQDVRQDWFKLETALLERWAPSEEDDETTIEPTPAAAPSINSIQRPERNLQGVIKAVVDGSNDSYYVDFENGSGYCGLTRDVTEALRIRCNSLSDATLLERIDGPRRSWLAVQWWPLAPKLGAKSADYSYVPLVDSKGLKSSWSRDSPCQLMVCNVSTNGEVMPFWKDSDDRKITLTPFRNGGWLHLVVDPDTYERDYTANQRVKLFMEAAD